MKILIFLLAGIFWLYLSVLEKTKVMCDISKKQQFAFFGSMYNSALRRTQPLVTYRENPSSPVIKALQNITYFWLEIHVMVELYCS